MSNTALLCKRHHRAVHEGRVQVCLDLKGQIVFFTPRGKAIAGAPPAGAEVGPPPEAAGMDASPAAAGGSMDARLEGVAEPFAGAPRWKRDGDIPWAVEARAWEALDSG